MNKVHNTLQSTLYYILRTLYTSESASIPRFLWFLSRCASAWLASDWGIMVWGTSILQIGERGISASRSEVNRIRKPSFLLYNIFVCGICTSGPSIRWILALCHSKSGDTRFPRASKLGTLDRQYGFLTKTFQGEWHPVWLPSITVAWLVPELVCDMSVYHRLSLYWTNAPIIMVAKNLSSIPGPTMLGRRLREDEPPMLVVYVGKLSYLSAKVTVVR